MDLFVISGVALLSGSAGMIAMGALSGHRVRSLRELVDAKDAALASQGGLLREANDELRNLGSANIELRTAHRSLDRQLGRAKAEIAELTPLAEIGRRAKAQRDANIAKMNAARKQRRPASAAN